MNRLIKEKLISKYEFKIISEVEKSNGTKLSIPVRIKAFPIRDLTIFILSNISFRLFLIRAYNLSWEK